MMQMESLRTIRPVRMNSSTTNVGPVQLEFTIANASF
jgi:hypothetical protein